MAVENGEIIFGIEKCFIFSGDFTPFLFLNLAFYKLLNKMVLVFFVLLRILMEDPLSRLNS